MFKVSLHDTNTLSWWYEERFDIDFEPIYQRKAKIWAPKDKAFLIDSILNKYDIPKLYLADFTYMDSPLNTAKKKYAVIDGKQRLESIINFFDGDLSLNEDFKYYEEPSLQLGGLYYHELRDRYPKIARSFDNFPLPVMSVMSDEKERINDLFVRLNRSKPLTGSEIRSAMGGFVPKYITLIATHSFFDDKISFSAIRKQDEEIAAKFLLIEHRGRFVDTKKVHLDRLVIEGRENRNDDFNERDIRASAFKVIEVLDTMSRVFINHDPLLKTSGPLPVYYWLLRNIPPEMDVYARDFLVDFEQLREWHRKMSASPRDVSIEDPEILRYEIINRNPNDQGSLNERYEILLRRFGQFVKSQFA